MERPSHGGLAGDVSRRVHSIIAAAESEAAGLRREAEREAERIRRDAEEEAGRIADEARAYADQAVRERLRIISEVSDAVVERTEMLLDRMSGAAQVKGQLESLMRALGDAAETLARETGQAPAFDVRPADAPRAQQQQPPAQQQPAPQAPPAPEEAPEPDPAPEPAAPPPEPPAAPPEAAAPPPEPPQQRPARLVAQGRPSTTRRGGTAAESQFDGARLVALQMAVGGSSREEVAVELERTFDLPDTAPILDDVFGNTGPRRASPAGR